MGCGSCQLSSEDISAIIPHLGESPVPTPVVDISAQPSPGEQEEERPRVLSRTFLYGVRWMGWFIQLWLPKPPEPETARVPGPGHTDESGSQHARGGACNPERLRPAPQTCIVRVS